MSVKPLESIISYPSDAVIPTFESLKNWLTSPMFDATMRAFASYPEHSLLSDEGRALIYHLVRSMKPKVVVEVGTYRAGTSEIFARALQENGFGSLLTVSPHDGQRVPPIISTWPVELQQRVQFFAVNSMTLWEEIERQHIPIDIALIDGNHDYEYALFDIANAARFTKPGGIVVIDNIEQTGPFHAARDFLARTPGWTELGDSLRLSKEAPFAASKGWGGGGEREAQHFMAVLRAPLNYAAGPAPISTGNLPYHAASIGSVTLKMESPAPKGTLYVQTILRGFFDNGPNAGALPEQYIENSPPLHLDGEHEVVLRCEKLKIQQHSPSRFLAEILLSFVPDDNNSPLMLTEPPKVSA